MVASSSALSNGMSCVFTSTPGIAERMFAARYSRAGKRWLSICTSLGGVRRPDERECETADGGAGDQAAASDGGHPVQHLVPRELAHPACGSDFVCPPDGSNKAPTVKRIRSTVTVAIPRVPPFGLYFLTSTPHRPCPCDYNRLFALPHPSGEMRGGTSSAGRVLAQHKNVPSGDCVAWSRSCLRVGLGRHTRASRVIFLEPLSSPKVISLAPANFMALAVSFASNNKGFTGNCSRGSAMLRNSAASRKSMTSIVETTAASQYFQRTQGTAAVERGGRLPPPHSLPHCD